MINLACRTTTRYAFPRARTVVTGAATSLKPSLSTAAARSLAVRSPRTYQVFSVRILTSQQRPYSRAINVFPDFTSRFHVQSVSVNELV